MNNETVIGKCWHCSAELQSADYGRESDCRGCGKPTRVCRNCRWYAPERTNQCEEPMAERVLDKTHANFCDFFEPTTTPRDDGDKTSDDAIRQAAEDLFKF
jgi:primosomal protein N'